MKFSAKNTYKDFTSSEKNAGLVLLTCTIVSLFLANSPLGEDYIRFWESKFSGSSGWLDLSIEHWINDGLMTIFFLMVGLEIERELYAGELHPLHKAILPLTGAIGGMLFPALIFLVFNWRVPSQNGFGIPMATDIAFALGVLSLCSKRVPFSVKILLTAIAIIDDLGSVMIIALFYGGKIQLGFLCAALAVFIFLLILNRLKVHKLFPYLILGIPLWFFMLKSGIHPAISGVLLAFACPFDKGNEQSPSIKLQHFLHVPVAFFILPLFTLANTAIPFKEEFISGLTRPHALGIGFGLFIGKPLGIFLAFLIMIKLKIAVLPIGLSWTNVLAMGFLGGIGFTMSVFITQLAFSDEALIQSSKMMILLASCLSGLAGYLLFRKQKRATKINTN